MSDYETKVGTCTKVQFKEGLSLQCKVDVLKEKGFDIDLSAVEDESYIEDDRLVMVDYEIYEVKNTIDNYGDSGDLCIATKNPDGSISYVLRYYNGGTYFQEMLSDAIEEMEKE